MNCKSSSIRSTNQKKKREKKHISISDKDRHKGDKSPPHSSYFLKIKRNSFISLPIMVTCILGSNEFFSEKRYEKEKFQHCRLCVFNSEIVVSVNNTAK